MKKDSIKEQIDQSQSGAPAGGQAVRDIFSTDEIFHRIVATADEDFNRSTRLLFLSGVAAGLSIGLTFVARSAMTGAAGPEISLFIAVISPWIYTNCNREIPAVYRKYAYPCYTRPHPDC